MELDDFSELLSLSRLVAEQDEAELDEDDEVDEVELASELVDFAMVVVFLLGASLLVNATCYRFEMNFIPTLFNWWQLFEKKASNSSKKRRTGANGQRACARHNTRPSGS